MIKINLGSGQKYLSGYINCDVVKTIKADKYFDLNKLPYPFKESFADEILMDNVLEHVEDISKVMGELYRILKNKGTLKIFVPYFKSDGAFQDPTHKHFFTEQTMNYFSEGFEYNYYTNIRFKQIKVKLFCGKKTFLGSFRQFLPFKGILKLFLFNIYDGIYYELKALK